ncbi:hypothetical protein KY346_04740 [Candidatus Woesearchaeota archaeon]|nr:hypothetical protein [Candidatus Woesearchaeota archaeon]
MKKELILLILVLVVLVGCSQKFPADVTGEAGQPLAPCRDTDGGAKFYTYGEAKDYYTTRSDYCVDDKMLYEGVCATFQWSGYVPHMCEHGCMNGKCV